jgi:hypothetical protein
MRYYIGASNCKTITILIAVSSFGECLRLTYLTVLGGGTHLTQNKRREQVYDRSRLLFRTYLKIRKPFEFSDKYFDKVRLIKKDRFSGVEGLSKKKRAAPSQF